MTYLNRKSEYDRFPTNIVNGEYPSFNGYKEILNEIMDGIFVPSISYGMPIIKSIRPRTSLIFDVHLMIENPEQYYKDTNTPDAEFGDVEEIIHPGQITLVSNHTETGSFKYIVVNPLS